MLKFTKKHFILLLLITILTSCVSRVNKHGFMFDLSDYEQLKAEVSTKDFVLRAMGMPTIITDFDKDETWIYYSEDVNNFLFFKPSSVNRTILSIKFNNDTIRELQQYNLADEEKIAFASNYTKVRGHEEPGFFQSIFGNIGQVKAQ